MMNMLKKYMAVPATLSVLLMLFTAGCASQGGQDYTRAQTRSAMTIRHGVVTEVRTVQVSEDPSGTGAVVGGVAGGVVGSLFGGGAGRVLSTLGGAAVGALGGVAAEKALTNKEVYQITVQLDNGSSLAIVQDKDIDFRAGDRVNVLTAGDGSARVQHE
ncbi:MAG: glycine zipper 2TM domain-containing protein [Deltaproteobacteria bacterium]|jgi:outer membrane lipoprotein SlyB|nr:glycine zipper 2TM domain-containing protein [Deltaproteobacteria bacterium]